jgi:thioesterase domain-containing protein/acyl carrier protein
MIPGQFEILSHLPLTPNGKVDVRSLPDSPTSFAPKPEERPATPEEERLARIWRELLKLESIGINHSFFAVGGNSLLAVILLDRIQREFGVLLPLSAFLHAPTVAQMAVLLGNDPAQEPEVQRCLVPLQPQGASPPLFLVHGIGGGVLNYRRLAELLGSAQPCYALQAPALAGLPHEFETIAQMATRYLREVRQVQPTGPYYLGGQSFGGTVAYEMARQLKDAGEAVALVALLDTRGPGYPRYRPAVQRLACHLTHVLQSDPTSRSQYLRVRFGAVRENLMRSLLFRLYRRFQSDSSSLPSVLQDIGLSHTEASRQYQRVPLDVPLVLFRASEQPVGSYPDPHCGWSELAQGPLEVVEVPGDHVSIVDEPYVRVLAEHLTEALERARAGRLGQPAHPSVATESGRECATVR